MNKGCVHMSTSSTHSPSFPHLQLCHPAHTHKYTQVNTMPDILIEYLMWLKSLWREGCHCSVILFLHLLFVFWQCMNKNVTLWTDSQCVVSSSGLSWEQMKWHIVFRYWWSLLYTWIESLVPRLLRSFIQFQIVEDGVECWHFIMLWKVTVDTVLTNVEDFFWNLRCHVIKINGEFCFLKVPERWRWMLDHWHSF